MYKFVCVSPVSKSVKAAKHSICEVTGRHHRGTCPWGSVFIRWQPWPAPENTQRESRFPKVGIPWSLLSNHHFIVLSTRSLHSQHGLSVLQWKPCKDQPHLWSFSRARTPGAQGLVQSPPPGCRWATVKHSLVFIPDSPTIPSPPSFPSAAVNYFSKSVSLSVL